MTTHEGPCRPRPSGGAVPLLAAIVALGLATTARADTGAPAFDDANRAFVEGHPAAAAAGFEKLAGTLGWSAPLLYNLGNAYAQEGSVGRAILSYERAAWLAPRAPDIAANLAFVRTTRGLSTPVLPWHRSLTRLLSPSAWTALAASGLWLAAAALLVAWKRRSRQLALGGALAAVAAVISVAALAILDRDLDDAVVVAKRGTPVHVSPFDGAAVEDMVSEGEDVVVVGRHGEFARVRDGRGRAGWVESAAIQLVVPRSS